MTVVDLLQIGHKYLWPEGVTLALPTPNASSFKDFGDYVMVNQRCLEVGISFPFHRVACDMLVSLGVEPGNLKPNAWVYITSYILR